MRVRGKLHEDVTDPNSSFAESRVGHQMVKAEIVEQQDA